MKRTIAIALIVIMALSLAACGASSGSEFAGTYKCTQSKLVGEENWSTDEAFVIELKGNGKGTSTRDGETYDLTWKLDGENFTMSETFLGITLDYTGTMKDGKIEVFNGDPENDFTYQYTFEKQ